MREEYAEREKLRAAAREEERIEWEAIERTMREGRVPGADIYPVSPVNPVNSPPSPVNSPPSLRTPKM